jgi:NTE family protein
VGEIGDFRMVPWLAALPARDAVLADGQRGLAAVFAGRASRRSCIRPTLSAIAGPTRWSRWCAISTSAMSGPRAWPRKFFVSATNVRTGKIKVFQAMEITPEALLASACLPTVFQTVEIGGEAYWDGGFSGNPALFPLYEPELPDDILVVSINPMRRDDIPDTPLEIQNRINEISFNASLLGELRAINFVRRLIAEGRMEAGKMKAVNVHMISDDRLMNELSADSKQSPTPWLLERLKEAGRKAADRFLKDGGSKIGQEASADLRGLLG